ncbi:MAG TPA: hypothetical protein VM619_02565 [Luteimonas sp.]|nr:hypothetical protein [Luteimonas sp.]
MLWGRQYGWYGQVVIEPSQGAPELFVLLRRKITAVAECVPGNKHPTGTARI